MSKVISFIQIISTVIVLTLASSCQKQAMDIELDDRTKYEIYRDSILQSWDSITVQLRDEIINNLTGKWAIDTLAIEYQNTYSHRQLGIQFDTLLTDFGTLDFGLWMFQDNGFSDSSSFENMAELIYNDTLFTIKFDYLLYVPGQAEVFSFLDKEVKAGHHWDTTTGRRLDYLGLFDNVQIVYVSPTEFYLRGLNRGIRKLKLRKI